jgi:hypothetical protein
VGPNAVLCKTYSVLCVLEQLRVDNSSSTQLGAIDTISLRPALFVIKLWFFFQYLMQLPHQSLELLKQQILPIISHGNLFDKARTMYCYVRCYVAATTNSPEKKRKPGKKKIIYFI